MSAVSMHKRIVFFGTCGLLVLCASTPAALADECCEADADAIIASDPAMGDFFGWSVSVDGNYAVVGAPNKDVIEDDDGSAYIFTFNVGNQTWEEQTLLTAGLNAEVDAHFGYSVAICGDVAVIGAYRQNNGPSDWAGAAYIFERDGVNWNQTAKLTPSDPGHPHQFGWSVAISGEVVVIGAVAADSDDPPVANPGAAYVWIKPAGGWADSAMQTAKLTASNAVLDDLFGQSVSIDGDVIVVGAPRQGADEGSGFVFTKPPNGWADANEDFFPPLQASDGAVGDKFGSSVSIDGDRIVIGAPFHDSDPPLGDDEGAAYVFHFDGDDWLDDAKFSGCNEANHDQFGTSVAISGDVAVIGAIQPVGPVAGNGTADAFRRFTVGWAQVGKPNASDGQSADSLGQSVSISGDFVFIGAPFAEPDPPPVQLGAFYVFDNFDLAGACVCPWDLNGDGSVGAADLLALLAAWGPCPDPPAECPADFDDSGSVGANDLLALLANWGQCVEETIPLRDAQDCIDKFYPDEIAALIACIEAFGG